MSDSSRKRSRKAKLVPRECVEIEDDSVPNLQTKAWKKPVKILPKASAPQTTPTSTITSATDCDDFEALIDNERNKPPQLEFNITVAVEEFDENSTDLVIDEKFNPESIDVKSTENKKEEPKSKNISQPELRVLAYNSKTQLNQGEQTNSPVVDFEDPSKLYILDRDKIIAITNNIINNSINPADRLIGIEVKNCMGNFPITNRDKFQEKIQKVFDQWQDWQKVLLPKFRSPPLFYKCYICQLSWWHLYDFIKHIKNHDDVQIDLEESTLYEANVIAFNDVKDIIKVKQFQTEGNCPKCEKDFAVHTSENRLLDGAYKCKVTKCLKIFHTCFLLKHHETTCHTVAELTGSTLLGIQWKKTCEVCGIVCHTQVGYRTHMNLQHSVRSDLVIPVPVKRCQLCLAKYAYSTAHQCGHRGLSMQCQCCFRVFPHGLLYNAHKNKTGSVTCRICNEVLPLWCMEVEHLMKHTDQFQIVFKCVSCTNVNYTVFLDEEAATHHEFTNHIRTRNYEPAFGISLRYLDKMIIPKAALQFSRSVVEGVPQIAIQDERKNSTDTIPAPELRIKQEIIDNFETSNTGISNPEDVVIKEENNVEDNLVIEENVPIGEDFVIDETPVSVKEEIVYEENVVGNKIKPEYSVKIERPDDNSRIFGVKIEPTDIVKQEDEESEYEDDIIRLDYNFENMDDVVEVNAEQVLNEVMEIDSHDSDDKNDVPDKRSPSKTRKLYRCNKCGVQLYHKAYKEHIQTDCDTNVENKGCYRCTKCNCTYKTFKKFIEHFFLHGLPSKSCPVCLKLYESFPTLLSHVSMHIRTKYMSVRMITLHGDSAGFNFQCKTCKTYVNKPEFFSHWEQHLTIVENSEGTPSAANLPRNSQEFKEDKMASTKPIDDFLLQQLLEHLQSFEFLDRMRPGCIICHKYFARRYDLKRHLIEHLLSNAYSNKPKYNCLRCQICGKGFKKAEGYKKHMRDHGSLPVYKCEICDKTFSDSSNFTKHKKIHNVNAFTCDICGKRFQAKHSIIKHMAIHETQKPLICIPCNKVFYLPSAYRKHNRVAHDKTPHRFGCPICAVKFNSLKDKWDHLWHVHKERKYKADCLLCPKSYRRFLDLKHHLKAEHQTGLMQHTRMAKLQGSSKNVYELLKDTQIVGLRSSDETLVIYE